jgi:hypothetical protein
VVRMGELSIRRTDRDTRGNSPGTVTAKLLTGLICPWRGWNSI